MSNEKVTEAKKENGTVKAVIMFVAGLIVGVAITFALTTMAVKDGEKALSEQLDKVQESYTEDKEAVATEEPAMEEDVEEDAEEVDSEDIDSEDIDSEEDTDSEDIDSEDAEVNSEDAEASEAE